MNYDPLNSTWDKQIVGSRTLYPINNELSLDVISKLENFEATHDGPDGTPYFQYIKLDLDYDLDEDILITASAGY